MQSHSSESEFLYHIPCKFCTSSDGGSLYSDGHAYCFVCNKVWDEDGMPVEEKEKEAPGHMDLTYSDIPSRGLHAATCQKWGYGQNQHGEWVATYRHAGQVTGYKIRKKGRKKSFVWEGGHVGLYGEWLWKQGGKRITVTEGETDALSASQANGLKYPVVGVPNGAGGAKKAFLASLDFLESFDEVVIMFDMDDPGQKAAKECAALLSPGKAFIAHLEANDVNDLLKAGSTSKIMSAYWEAKPWRPDGVLSWDAVMERVRNYDVEPVCSYPFHDLDTKLRGMRKGEIILTVAGVGSGKSTFCKQLGQHVVDQGLKLGVMSLEEPVAQYAVGLAGMKMGENLYENAAIPQEREDFWKALESFRDKVVFYDDQGTRDDQSLFAKLRYMSVAEGCQVLILDHLTVVIGSGDKNQVAHTDQLMGDLEALVKRTGMTLIVVMHLRKASGGIQSAEEGGRITLNDIRGSGLLYALAHTVIGIERNQQADDSDVAKFRSLKCRHTGYTGEAGQVSYDRKTGRLSDYDPCFGKPQEEGDPFE